MPPDRLALEVDADNIEAIRTQFVDAAASSLLLGLHARLPLLGHTKAHNKEWWYASIEALAGLAKINKQHADCLHRALVLQHHSGWAMHSKRTWAHCFEDLLLPMLQEHPEQVHMVIDVLLHQYKCLVELPQFEVFLMSVLGRIASAAHALETPQQHETVQEQIKNLILVLVVQNVLQHSQLHQAYALMQQYDGKFVDRLRSEVEALTSTANDQGEQAHSTHTDT